MLGLDPYLLKVRDYARAECDFWRTLYESGGF
jgi:hypothetical protein